MISISDIMIGNHPVTSQSTALAKSEYESGDQKAWVPKSWFTDPFALLDSLGLGYKSSPSSLSYDTLRQMSEKNTVVSAIIQTRVHQVASFTKPQPNKYSIGFRVRHVDEHKRLTPSDLERVKYLETFLKNCGEDPSPDRDNLTAYVKKLVRDRLTYDQIATEKVNRYNGKPHSFYAVAGNTIRLASVRNRKGAPLLGDDAKNKPKYCQIVDGVIVNTYTPEELGFSVANPRTDIRAWGYGFSELEMLITTVTSQLWAEEWNRRLFSQGSTTKGILNIKGNIPPQQMDAFKRLWLTQVSGVSNAWRTPVINSNDDIQWISLQPTNQEMGFQMWMEYLIKIACACYLIDPSEINFDTRGGPGVQPMFMTTNEAQQKVSKDRGLRPLLEHVQDHLNKFIVTPIDPNYVFEYVGMDAKTEEQAIQLRLQELQSYKTLNEVRALEQLPPVEHGDIVPNPTYIGYRNQKEMMAAQQAQMGGGMGGMPPQPGHAEHEAGQAVKQELGGKPKPKALPAPKTPDRYTLDESEDWETTYRAVKPADLRKATVMFDDITRR